MANSAPWELRDAETRRNEETDREPQLDSRIHVFNPFTRDLEILLSHVQRASHSSPIVAVDDQLVVNPLRKTMCPSESSP